MRIETMAQNGSCDAVFLAPHLRDVPLGCARRLQWLAAQGKRALVAVAFGAAPAASPWLELLAGCGADWFDLGLPAAAERDPAFRHLGAAVFEERRGDEAAQARLAATLEELLRIARPGALYLPLAVGGHVDHRLAHAAGLKVAASLDAANVYLYEERPSALLPGAVRLRMGQVAARLPPAGLPPAAAGMLLACWRFAARPYVACAPAGPAERLRASLAFARSWRQTRDWRPLRALGLRLQPVVHDYADAKGDELVQQALACLAREGSAQGFALPRLRAIGERYERGLAGGGRAERYWLLLPDAR